MADELREVAGQVVLEPQVPGAMLAVVERVEDLALAGLPVRVLETAGEPQAVQLKPGVAPEEADAAAVIPSGLKDSEKWPARSPQGLMAWETRGSRQPGLVVDYVRWARAGAKLGLGLEPQALRLQRRTW